MTTTTTPARPMPRLQRAAQAVTRWILLIAFALIISGGFEWLWSTAPWVVLGAGVVLFLIWLELER